MDTTKNVRNIIWWLLVGMMLLIYCFSAQSSKESTEISQPIGKKIAQSAGVAKTETMTKGQQSRAAKTEDGIERGVRKVAHAFVFSCLGFLLYAFVSTYPLKPGEKRTVALGAGVLFAVLDEIHQFFVPGRSPRVVDVLIDTAGILLGMFLFVAVLNLYPKKSKKVV